MARPPLTSDLSEAELRRWYWLRSELADFARELGLRTAGSKQVLTERLAAHLAGRQELGADRTPGRRARDGSAQLAGDLSLASVIPPGQRCGQTLRAFFEEQIGRTFRFDAAMREYVADNSGRTLGDAVAYWYSSRTEPRAEIGPQFELNRFTRQWHQDNPAGSRAELLAAWRLYRSLPTDARPVRTPRS